MNTSTLVTTGALVGLSLANCFLSRGGLPSTSIPNLVQRNLIEPLQQIYARAPSPFKHSLSALLDNAWIAYLILSLHNQAQSRSFHQMSSLEQSFQIQGAVVICYALHGVRFLLLNSNLSPVHYLGPSYSELDNS